MTVFGKTIRRRKPKRADWWEIEGRLQDIGIMPWDRDRMTIPEIILALENREDHDPRKAPKGAQASGAAGIQKHAAWLRSLTLRGRLQAYREGKL